MHKCVVLVDLASSTMSFLVGSDFAVKEDFPASLARADCAHSFAISWGDERSQDLRPCSKPLELIVSQLISC
jgi:hypothetical protein